MGGFLLFLFVVALCVVVRFLSDKALKGYQAQEIKSNMENREELTTNAV